MALVNDVTKHSIHRREGKKMPCTLTVLATCAWFVAPSRCCTLVLVFCTLTVLPTRAWFFVVVVVVAAAVATHHLCPGSRAVRKVSRLGLRETCTVRVLG